MVDAHEERDPIQEEQVPSTEAELRTILGDALYESYGKLPPEVADFERRREAMLQLAIRGPKARIRKIVDEANS